MQLTGYLHREHDQIMSQRTNSRVQHVSVDADGNPVIVRHEATLTFGVLHDDTGQMLSIVVHPNGHIGMSYSHVDQPVEMMSLGQFNADGTLEIHEPTPMQEQQ